MSLNVAVVGLGRTPYNRDRAGEEALTVDEYVAWASDLALQDAGMTKRDFEQQGLGIAHSEAGHTVNWSAATAELLGITPKILLRADQGGGSAGALLIRAASLIEAGVVDRFLLIGADTSRSIPSVAPGLPLTPERTSGIFWDFQGPFGVMGANAQFALAQARYAHEYSLDEDQLGKVAVTARYHASLNPQAIFRDPITLDDYRASPVLSDPIRLLDCVPMVNGGLAYVLTSAETARGTRAPVKVRGFGEINNYYAGSRMRPDVTTTGFRVCGAEAFDMAGIQPQDVDVFMPYDDYPFVVMLQLEDYGFCDKGRGDAFIRDHDLRIGGDLPLLTDGGQLSGGQPGGAVGGFMPIVESVTQLRGEAEGRQVNGASVAVSSGFGGMTYARLNRCCVSIVFEAGL